MQAELLVLRTIHILGGIFWLGSGLFTTFFLIPALGAAGPAAGPVMAGLERRRLFVALPVVALLTIASGARLMWIVSGGFSEVYFNSPGGRVFAWGGVAAIASFMVSVSVSRPAAARTARLTQAAAFSAAAADDGLAAKLRRLHRVSLVSGMIAVALLIVAAVAMAVGRYV